MALTLPDRRRATATQLRACISLVRELSSEHAFPHICIGLLSLPPRRFSEPIDRVSRHRRCPSESRRLESATDDDDDDDDKSKTEVTLLHSRRYRFDISKSMKYIYIRKGPSGSLCPVPPRLPPRPVIGLASSPVLYNTCK